jgi:hypothetical protein
MKKKPDAFFFFFRWIREKEFEKKTKTKRAPPSFSL